MRHAFRQAFMLSPTLPAGPIDLTVITATWQRHAMLAHCLRQFAAQSTGGLRCEHLVVSDGPDEMARFLAQRAAARYSHLPEPRGSAGAYAKDCGIQQARGEYVCFWDDDNFYAPHALSTLFAAVCGQDLGVVRTQHRLRKRPGVVTIPRRWNGEFVFGDVDTMCVMVRRSLACLEPWGDGNSATGTDFRWLARLQKHRPAMRYVPVVIGEHL